jgi:hypothetical protein
LRNVFLKLFISDDFTSSSSDEDNLEDTNQDDLVILTTMASNTNDLFNSHEMEEGEYQFV